MIDINNLREYYRRGKVIITIHAQERLRQRGIKITPEQSGEFL